MTKVFDAIPRDFFPAGVGVSIADDGAEPSDLFPEEASAIERAVPSRRREFTLGRMCAREALAQIGVPSCAIPVGAHREPIWPAGIVGSITHTAGIAGAVVASTTSLRSIGLDVERADALSPELVRMICTESEIAWAAAHTREATSWPKVIFSAKEAVHKCIWPVHHQLLDFTDVELTIDPDQLVFTVQDIRNLSAQLDLSTVIGRITVAESFVVTCAFVPTND